MEPGPNAPNAPNAIVEALWAAPDQTVYAVLDAARDPAIVAKLLASDARSACLYEGRIPKKLADVAPYLVKLSREHRLTEQLLESGWGRSEPRNEDGSPSHNLFGLKAGGSWPGDKWYRHRLPGYDLWDPATVVTCSGSRQVPPPKIPLLSTQSP